MPGEDSALEALRALVKVLDANDERNRYVRTRASQIESLLAQGYTWQQVLSTDSPVQGDLRETLQEVTRAAEQVRALTDYLERHPESLIRGRRPSGDTK